MLTTPIASIDRDAQVYGFAQEREARVLEQAHASARELIEEKFADVLDERRTLELIEDVCGTAIIELLERERSRREELADKLRDARTELAVAGIQIANLREQLTTATGHADANARELAELRSSLAVVRESVAPIIGGAGIGARSLVPLPPARRSSTAKARGRGRGGITRAAIRSPAVRPTKRNCAT